MGECVCAKGGNRKVSRYTDIDRAKHCQGGKGELE